MTATARDDIPPAALETAANAFFDCIGVTLAGTADTVGSRAAAYALAQDAAGPGTLLATGRRTAPSLAAFANGTAAHALEHDDTTGFGHPSAVMVPALLATAESMPGPVTGGDLSVAYVLGLEAGLALFRGGAGRRRYDQVHGAFHATGIFGRLAAAAACARLRGLDLVSTRNALGIVASTASGLVANFGTMTKPLHAGFAARDAVVAVELAAQGWNSTESIIEGAGGLLHAVFGDARADADDIVGSLGRPFVTPLALAFKAWPTCGFNAPAIHSVLQLLVEEGIDDDDVESVEVERATVSPEVLLYDWPRDAMQARFSIRYNVAAALAFGAVGLAAFEDRNRSEPRLRSAFDRVRLVDGPDRRRDATTLRLRTRDGRVLERTTALRDVPGTAFNPLPDGGLRAKFLANAGRALPAERAAAAADAWERLPSATDVRALVKTVR